MGRISVNQPPYSSTGFQGDINRFSVKGLGTSGRLPDVSGSIKQDKIDELNILLNDKEKLNSLLYKVENNISRAIFDVVFTKISNDDNPLDNLDYILSSILKQQFSCKVDSGLGDELNRKIISSLKTKESMRRIYEILKQSLLEFSWQDRCDNINDFVLFKNRFKFFLDKNNINSLEPNLSRKVTVETRFVYSRNAIPGKKIEPFSRVAFENTNNNNIRYCVKDRKENICTVAIGELVNLGKMNKWNPLCLPKHNDGEFTTEKYTIKFKLNGKITLIHNNKERLIFENLSDQNSMSHLFFSIGAKIDFNFEDKESYEENLIDESNISNSSEKQPPKVYQGSSKSSEGLEISDRVVADKGSQIKGSKLIRVYEKVYQKHNNIYSYFMNNYRENFSDDDFYRINMELNRIESSLNKILVIKKYNYISSNIDILNSLDKKLEKIKENIFKIEKSIKDKKIAEAKERKGNLRDLSQVRTDLNNNNNKNKDITLNYSAEVFKPNKGSLDFLSDVGETDDEGDETDDDEA